MLTEVAVLELALLAIRVGKLAVDQVSLMNLDELPPEKRTELLNERDSLNDSLARLDALGKDDPSRRL